jgi:hypothetical protein
VIVIMALVREPMAMYDGGYVDAEPSAFDALGYGGGLDSLLGVDAAALFDFGAYAHNEPAGAYVPISTSWAGTGPSVLTFDRTARGQGAQAAAAAMVGAEEEADCDAWIDAMDGDDQAAPASSTIGFDPVSGCFSLTQRPGGARRPFGLLFPGTSSGTTSADAAPPARIAQKRTSVVRMQDAEPRPAKKQCGTSRKTSKPKPPAPSTTSPNTKDPQSLTAKVTPPPRLHFPLLEFSAHYYLGISVDLNVPFSEPCCRTAGRRSASGSGHCRSWCPTAPR